MKNKFILTLGLALSLCTFQTASAGIIKLPKEAPVVSVNVPDKWDSDDTEKGISCESPDKEATILFEVTSAKKIDELISENVDWLTEQKVEIDEKSQKSNDFESGGMKWKSLAWKGKSEEWGPANIILAFADTGKGKVLMITYWVTEKGEAKHGKALSAILDSVKKLGS